MTREEKLLAKKARIEKVSYTRRVWTPATTSNPDDPENEDMTLEEYCRVINPSMKYDDIISVHVEQKTCKEKKDKKGNLKTFLKVIIESSSDIAEFPLSFNGEDSHFKAGDELDIETVVIRTEYCGADFNEYVFGEVL